MKIDITDYERGLLLRFSQLGWENANENRMRTRPGSKDERVWLEYQQEIELLQAKLK